MGDAACIAPAPYRPRRARDSPLYRLAETHHERFAGRYGPWRAAIERTLFAFLDCGIEDRGFARVRCAACPREFRVALSCKTRAFCPSCHAKRAVLWAEWLAGEVLAPVSHHPWVFTVPKRLRLFFLHDRRLLGALSRCAWRTVRDLYRAGLRDRLAVPGRVVSIQTYGDLANWQPHLHALVTAGVAAGAGGLIAPASSGRRGGGAVPAAGDPDAASARPAGGRGGGGAAVLAACGILRAQRDPRGTLGHGGRRAVVPFMRSSA